MDTAKRSGNAILKREEIHRMADANSVFAHFCVNPWTWSVNLDQKITKIFVWNKFLRYEKLTAILWF